MFLRGLFSWIGFKQVAVMYERPGRFAGETKYPFRKMLRFAIDGITSFSIIPLRFATWLGVLSGFAAIGAGAWAFYIKVHGDRTVPGWTTIMILVALGSSAQLLVMGILGEYVGAIHTQVRNRPLVIEQERINFPPDQKGRRETGSASWLM